jgi:hypothetical protein
MRIGRTLALAGSVSLLAVAPSVAASAATVRVAGTITEVSPGTCGDFVQTGMMLRFHCDDVIETWAGGISGIGVFDEDVSLNLVSGEILVSGTETFVGCVGDNCGTLDWVYDGASGKVNLQTSEFIILKGAQHFTGGTGGLTGARGSVRFSLVGEGPGTYEGFVVL